MKEVEVAGCMRGGGGPPHSLLVPHPHSLIEGLQSSIHRAERCMGVRGGMRR